MKLHMKESNYPDNVSWDDPNFYPTDPQYDPDNIRFAKIEYTGTDEDGDIVDETLYVDKFNGSAFVDEVLDNAEGIVQDYISDDGIMLTGIGTITFVDYDGNEFDSSVIG